MSGYVYMITEWDKIENNNNPVKIGVTSGSVEKRLKKLQTGNNSKLHLINSYKTEYPFKLEKMLHTHYYPFRSNGEWFNLTDEIIMEFTKVCREKENVIKLLMQENPYYS